MKIRYVGPATQKVLSDSDMEKLGVEDHPGLWWTPAMPVLEVPDDIGQKLIDQVRDLEIEPDQAEELEESHTKEELARQAKELGISGTSKMTKEELATAIAEAQSAPVAVDDAGDRVEPTS